MWILSQTGFVSVVRHREDRARLLVRSRDRESLEAFCASARVASDEIVRLEDADYRFRVLATNEDLKRFLERTVDELDYDNFKARVWQTRGHVWHQALMNVRGTLRRLQPAAPGDAG